MTELINIYKNYARYCFLSPLDCIGTSTYSDFGVHMMQFCSDAFLEGNQGDERDEHKDVHFRASREPSCTR